MPGLRAQLDRRVQRFFARRAPLRPPPLRLPARAIYILPTRNGLYFAALVFVMLLGSMNYNNSLGFALTFLLAAAGLVTMHQTQRNLLGLQVHNVTADPVTAGNSARFCITLYNPTRKSRYGLCIRSDQAAARPVNTERDMKAATLLDCPAPHRGRLPCPRLRVETVYPMGLFRAWSWVHVEASAIVYPEPAGDSALPQAAHGDEEADAQPQPGDTEFAGHRAYTAGDNTRRIDWKASARTDSLIVSRYTDSTRNSERWLDAAQLMHLDREARLSQLALWVEQAHAADLRYGLCLPDRTIEPATGRAHARECLTALALQP